MIRSVSRVTITPLKASIAADLNREQACGVEDWSVDQPVDVTNCDDSSLFVINKWIRSNSYEVDDNILRIGDFVLVRR
jgi:hypothetical protein